MSALHDVAFSTQTESDTTAACDCMWEGRACIAIFIRNSLHLQPGHQNTRRQIAGCPTQAAFRDGDGWQARFNSVTDMTFVPLRNALLVCDSGNHRVRMVGLASPYTVSTISGFGKMGNYVDGSIRLAQFAMPHSLCASADGLDIYVTDYNNNAVRKIDTRNGTVETILGGKNRTPSLTRYLGTEDNKKHAVMSRPTGIKMEANNRFLLIVNSGANSILRLELRHSLGKTQGRWLRALACDALNMPFSLKTSIQVTPSGRLVVWRQRSFRDPSTMSLYNPSSGRILYQRNFDFTAAAFFLGVDPNRPGSLCYALRKMGDSQHNLVKISFTLGWDVMRLLLMATLKPASHKKSTATTFARLPMSLLQVICTFAGDPFGAGGNTFRCA